MLRITPIRTPERASGHWRASIAMAVKSSQHGLVRCRCSRQGLSGPVGGAQREAFVDLRQRTTSLSAPASTLRMEGL